MANAKTVIGLFDSRAEAEQGVSALIREGFAREELSIVAGDPRTMVETPAVGPVHGVGADTEAGSDAAIGAIAGFVVGVVALAIPGLGPLIAAGPMAAGIGGLGIGAAAGGLIGVLKDHGVSEDEAEYYEEGLRRGGAIVTARVPEDRAGEAARALDRAGAADILKRAEEWRAAGWTPSPRVRRAG
jgi:hypothetical protein